MHCLSIYLYSVYYLLYSNMYGGVQEFKHPQIVLLCICFSSCVCTYLLLFLLCNVPDSVAIVCIFLYLLFVILLICVSFNCWCCACLFGIVCNVLLFLLSVLSYQFPLFSLNRDEIPHEWFWCLLLIWAPSDVFFCVNWMVGTIASTWGSILLCELWGQHGGLDTLDFRGKWLLSVRDHSCCCQFEPRVWI